MNPKILEALAVAAEEVNDRAQLEEGDDHQLAHALRIVGDMLHHLSERASSPLFAGLKREIAESGGDGSERELKEIVRTTAAFLIVNCGHGQNEAFQAAIEICGWSSRSSLQRALAGAKDADTVQKIADWPSISQRIEEARTQAQYQAFMFPDRQPPDWRAAVLAVLAARAKNARAEVAQVSV